MISDPTAEFRAELKTLRDQVLQAIDGRVLGDLEDGLGLYARLVRATFHTRNELSEQFGPATPSSWINPYGREMEWLDDDLRTFIDRAWREYNPDTARTLLRLILSLMNDARLAGELAAHKQFLDLLRMAYSRAVGHDFADDSARSLARSIVTALRSYAEYKLVHGRVSGETDQLALEQSIQALFGMLKISIDRDAAGVSGCIVEITKLFEAVEFRQRPGRGSEDLSLALGVLSTYLVGVSGYLMARAVLNTALQGASAEVLSELRPLLTRLEPWRSLRLALNRDDRSRLPWSEWETSLWPDTKRGGTLGRIDDGIRTTIGLLTLITGHPEWGVENLDDLQSFDRKFTVEQVREAIRAASNQNWLLDAFPELYEEANREAVLAQFDELVRKYDEEIERERGELPLDRGKVSAMAHKIESQWLESTILRGDLVAASTPRPDAETRFGYVALVPKDYFTKSDVYADPEHLGETIAGAMVRGESTAALQALQGLPRLECALVDVRDRVQDLLTELRNSGGSPSVLVVNSWEALGLLVDVPALSDTDAAGFFDGARVDIEYSDENSKYLVVVDIAAALTTTHWPIDKENPFDEILANGLLLVGVEEISPAKAAEIVRDNLEFRRNSDGTLGTAADAERRLLAQSRVRALVHYNAELVDTSGGYVLVIEGDGDVDGG